MAVILALLSLLLCARPAPARQDTPGELLVRWRASAARPLSPGRLAELDSLNEALGLRSETPLLPFRPAAGRRAAPEPEAAALGRWSVLRFDTQVPAGELAERYARMSAVEAAQPNYLRRPGAPPTSAPTTRSSTSSGGWRPWAGGPATRARPRVC